MAADRVNKAKPGARTHHEDHNALGKWDEFTEKITGHIAENPLLYGVGVLVIIVAIAAGVVVRSTMESRAREQATAYAKAVRTEDPDLQVAELANVVDNGNALGLQAQYMLAEAAYKAADFDKAKQAFEKVRAVGDNQFAPQATEGLGYIAESQGDYDQALALYKEVEENWPGNFVSRHQQFNIARCLEEMEDYQGAKQAYEKQVNSFPQSQVAAQANEALRRLTVQHPELFPTPDQQADNDTSEEQVADTPTDDTDEAADNLAPADTPPSLEEQQAEPAQEATEQ